MDASLLHQSHGDGLRWLNLAHKWVQNIPLQLQRPETNVYWITLPSYIYIVQAPSNAVDICMDVSLAHQSHGGGLVAEPG